MVIPRTQFLGIGFGQNGSTSNCGAMAEFFAWAAAVSSRRICPTPSAPSSATNATPISICFRFSPATSTSVCGRQYTLHVRFRLGFAMGVVGVALAVLSRVGAHEIPNEVTVQTFLKPEGRRMMLLVRAPLKAMRDMDVPKRAGGYLDLKRVDPVLRDAAVLWIGDYVRLYEGDREVGQPQ